MLIDRVAPEELAEFELEFWNRVRKSPGRNQDCWLWDATVNNGGYGHVRFPRHRSPYPAHRVAWELMNRRPIPAGLHVLHGEDCPKTCVRHLFLGSHLDNMRSAGLAGKCGGNKLLAVDVRDIRARIARGETQRSVADRYGVSSTLVRNIATRKLHKGVD